MGDTDSTATAMPESDGRFIHLSKLGEGAFGDVLLARDRKLNRLVALKCLRQKSAILLAEAQALARVRHPFVCTIYDVLEEGSETYLVMEYLPRGSLRRHLKALRDDNKKLALADFRLLVLQLGEALEAIHEAGIVHRDVKPANVLLDDFGRWKVTDFGIAIPSGDQPVERFAGTPAYMAPEILDGESASPVSDQYSLAALLFEAATGEVPFPESNPATLRELVRSAPRPRLRDHRPEWPVAASDILARGLAGSARERYSSATEFAAALASSLEVHPMALNEETLLVATVGKTERLVASLLRWRPGRIVFISSPTGKLDSRSRESSILEATSAQGVSISPHRVEAVTVGNSESVLQSVEDIRREVGPQVHRWLARSGRRLIVDITGGTNAMAVSLGLVARLWPCEISYVGGERSDGGIGAVLPGTERLISMANPWDALGYQAAEHATVLFNSGAYLAAAESLARYRDRAKQEHVKRALATFCQLAQAYADWDGARHREALAGLHHFLSNQSDLMYFEFAYLQLREMAVTARNHSDFLTRLLNEEPPSKVWLIDLFADVLRRQAKHAHDDACARLYRLVEAIGQFALRSRHNVLDPSAVPLESLPGSLGEQWRHRASTEGNVSLALQDIFTVLRLMSDPVGKMFETLELHDPKRSALVSRNRSRLAHGFASASERTVADLLEKALTLSRAADLDLETTAPVFPTLTVSP